MGAFIIFDIEFEKKKDRAKFEEKYGIKKKHILVDEYSNSEGFVAWTYLRKSDLNPIYYMGFMGYTEPTMILKGCLNEGIKIKFLSWIPINEKDSKWKKIRGRW